MPKNLNLEIFLYLISRFFERAAYYGFRALIVLYMIGETINMDRVEAINIYGLFIGVIVFTRIIGGLLGDLWIGNRKAIIIGGILQTIGIFSLLSPTETGLYSGLLLIVLGSGLFAPNILANYGKLHLYKIKQLDSGFTLLYAVVGFCSFLGISTIGIIGEKLGFRYAFITAGLLMLLSVAPILIVREAKPIKNTSLSIPVSFRTLNIIIALFVAGIFWFLYEVSYIQVSELQTNFKNILSYNIPDSWWYSFNSVLFLPVGIILIIVWRYFYSSQFFKLLSGFIFGVLSLSILLMIPEQPIEQHFYLFMLYFIFWAIAELHIAPIILSVITQYGNPKYLAILISLVFIPGIFLNPIFLLEFFDDLFEQPVLLVKYAMTGMAVVAFGLAAFLILGKKFYKIKEELPEN